MPNIAAVLKEEIRHLARREIKRGTSSGWSPSAATCGRMRWASPSAMRVPNTGWKPIRDGGATAA